ncbi:protein serine/threonine phosphatase 2C [Sistotremastrum niveocremeum HHB9708]|uniref:Protein serine/threonine phosphatase 2C n=1 Tax=Sistotremastrum niveocremeum HHB9708 TaxID=1314777 RepID=A0A164UDR1_9AGAM|nr:protein serine/threonine phosphatase 2C [Sistotremastrum niveocremeum HHB9708]
MPLRPSNFSRSVATLSVHSRASSRCFHDFVRASAEGRTYRIPLTSKSLIGSASSRGTRSYQEDHFSIQGIDVDPLELKLSLKRLSGFDWDPRSLPEPFAGQILFAGIYDGHGGAAISEFLQNELHGLFETVDKSMIPAVYAWLKSMGGYFRRFQGGALTEWVKDPSSPEPLDLEARATLAFLEADRRIAEQIPQSRKMGSTASVALLQCLDSPPVPFFSSKRLALTVAHCGDTRILLCSTDGGQVYSMTQKHHAEMRGEAARLQRMGSGLITDSYGEARWMGALENTRGFGDGKFKPFGVTPEPEITTKMLYAPEWAFLVLVSDGVSSVLSDQEVVDIGRNAPDPQRAAHDILAFAEEMGTEDNATVIVLPLAGWGQVHGRDKTKDLRDLRSKQAIGSERQRRM